MYFVRTTWTELTKFIILITNSFESPRGIFFFVVIGDTFVYKRFLQHLFTTNV